MPDVTVVDDSSEAEVTPAVASAHEAAVAEGATAVQAQNAADSAAEAQAAAEVALAAASENAQTAEAVIEATVKAEDSERAAAVSAEMVHDALKGMQASIDVLAAELKAGRQQSAGPAPEKKTAPDQAPGSSGKRWVRS